MLTRCVETVHTNTMKALRNQTEVWLTLSSQKVRGLAKMFTFKRFVSQRVIVNTYNLFLGTTSEAFNPITEHYRK